MSDVMDYTSRLSDPASRKFETFSYLPAINAADMAVTGEPGTGRVRIEQRDGTLLIFDGREAHVMAHKDRHPQVGDHIELAEHIHGTGRSTFSWK